MRTRIHLDRQGSVAVEFALLAALFLLPLLLFAGDFVMIISAQSQLNVALQALYYAALTDPGNAGNATLAQNVINAINQHAAYQLTVPAKITVSGSSVNNPAWSYVCYTKKAQTPSFSAPSTTNNCNSATQSTIDFVNYKVSTTLSLPVPLPGVGSSLTLSAQGAIQAQ